MIPREWVHWAYNSHNVRHCLWISIRVWIWTCALPLLCDSHACRARSRWFAKVSPVHLPMEIWACHQNLRPCAHRFHFAFGLPKATQSTLLLVLIMTKHFSTTRFEYSLQIHNVLLWISSTQDVKSSKGSLSSVQVLCMAYLRIHFLAMLSHTSISYHQNLTPAANLTRSQSPAQSDSRCSSHKRINNYGSLSQQDAWRTCSWTHFSTLALLQVWYGTCIVLVVFPWLFWNLCWVSSSSVEMDLCKQQNHKIWSKYLDLNDCGSCFLLFNLLQWNPARRSLLA